MIGDSSRHAAEQETLKCRPRMPTNHDYVCIPFLRSVNDRITGRAFQNTCFNCESSRDKHSRSLVHHATGRAALPIPDIGGDCIQDLYFYLRVWSSVMLDQSV